MTAPDLGLDLNPWFGSFLGGQEECLHGEVGGLGCS